MLVAAAWASVVEAAEPTLIAQPVTGYVGKTVSVPIILNDAPTGLSGYDMVLTLSNGSVASIADIEFPGLGLTHYDLISSTEARIRAADTQRLIEGGVVNATLATLHVNGLKAGTTDITLQAMRLDDDGGSPIAPQALASTLKIEAITLSAKAATFNVGETVSVPVSLSNAPDGLAGFEIVVSLSDGSVASISGVAFPGFGLTHYEMLSSSKVLLKGVDLKGLVESGAGKSRIATLKITGLKAGTTKAKVQVVTMDDDAGNPIAPQVRSRVLTVN